MSNLLKKPKAQPLPYEIGRYERFHLTENPFPTEPVNRDSSDRRINGAIYEAEIRTKEYAQIESAFLKQPQSDRNRLRLGYIRDTSYIGRGNGKSAFLVNLARIINRNYCLDISDDVNKCFAVYVTPEPGGRTKTFSAFLDLVFEAMLKAGIIDICLTAIRLEAASTLYPDKDFVSLAGGDDVLVAKLDTAEWWQSQGVDINKLATAITENEHLQELPSDFPLMAGRRSLFQPFITTNDLRDYYVNVARKGRAKHDFVLSHMVHMFAAAGFNGAYLLVDDFERIPDFQSGRQRKDFAIELRSALLDGPYTNARMGFYTALLVLHAGVEQLVSEAWSSSGLENRYPITPKIESGHWIAFGKLTRNHVSLLLKKYLTAYRLPTFTGDELAPFSPDAISLIAEINENNAAKILQSCWNLLEKAVEEDERTVIDAAFVRERGELQGHDLTERGSMIEDPAATDLMKKATEGQA